MPKPMIRRPPVAGSGPLSRVSGQPGNGRSVRSQRHALSVFWPARARAQSRLSLSPGAMLACSMQLRGTKTCGAKSVAQGSGCVGDGGAGR